jgi:hypothetical protein
MILNKRFDLETIDVSFIKHPFSLVEGEMKNELFGTFNDNWRQKKYKIKDSSGLTSFILEPDSETAQVLLWQPVSIGFDLVVFLSNISDGWQTLINSYFDEHKHQIIRVRLSDSAKHYPAYLFEYMTQSNHRIIQALKDDDGWDFYQSGAILSLENETNYRKRKIADRLNSDIIIEYLKNDGIDINVENFWTSKGDAVEFSTKLSE